MTDTHRNLVQALISAHVTKEKIDLVKSNGLFVRNLKMHTNNWLNNYKKAVVPVLDAMYQGEPENGARYEQIFDLYERMAHWAANISVDRLEMAVMALEGIAKNEIRVEKEEVQ